VNITLNPEAAAALMVCTITICGAFSIWVIGKYFD
jgi:hypothetical protein